MPLLVSVVKDSWQQKVGTDDISSTALLAGLRTVGSKEATGWDQIIGPRLRFPDIEMIDRTTLVINIPQLHDYQVDLAETIRLVLPEEAMASRTSFVATPDLVIYPFSGFVSLDGPLSTGSYESALRFDEHVLLIKLTGNEFLPLLSNATHPRREEVSKEVLRGCVSDVAEPTGWNYQLAQLTASAYITIIDLERTIAEVRLPALATYQTSRPERVTVTLPGAAIKSQQPLVAGTFMVLADAGSAALSGNLLNANEEATIKNLDSEIVMTLTGDTWNPALRTDPVLARELVLGMSGEGDETSAGWDDVLQPYLHISNLRLASPDVLVLSIPRTHAFSIAAPQTVNVLLPGAALPSGRTIFTDPPLVIMADRGTVAVQLEHSYLSSEGELSMQDIVLTETTTLMKIFLAGDSWATDLGETNSTGFEDLANGMYSTLPTLGWRMYVRPELLKPGAITRYDWRELHAKLPATPAYSISTPETISEYQDPNPRRLLQPSHTPRFESLFWQP